MKRVVLITGAAGGLGGALLEAFVAGGWQVAAAGHRTLPKAREGCVWTGLLDVTKRDDVRRVVDEVVGAGGGLDVLVNNAGVIADGWVGRLGDADWDKVLDVHLKGAFLCCQAALPPMLRQGGGHILNVCSHAARLGGAGQSSYAAAKAGLVGLTLSLAREVGTQGVCVNAVMPGFMPTPMTARLPAETKAAYAAASVLGRASEADEAARWIAMLAESRAISGQVFALDGRVVPWC